MFDHEYLLFRRVGLPAAEQTSVCSVTAVSAMMVSPDAADIKRQNPLFATNSPQG
jgi:hypothetical protein